MAADDVAGDAADAEGGADGSTVDGAAAESGAEGDEPAADADEEPAGWFREEPLDEDAEAAGAASSG